MPLNGPAAAASQPASAARKAGLFQLPGENPDYPQLTLATLTSQLWNEFCKLVPGAK